MSASSVAEAPTGCFLLEQGLAQDQALRLGQAEISHTYSPPCGLVSAGSFWKQ